jgi:hypothetical protein
MQMSNPHDIEFHDDVELLINKLIKETGVSRKFADQARPALLKLYAEVPEAQRAHCINIIWEITRTQATSEAAAQRALVALRRQEKVRAAQAKRLVELQSELQTLANTLKSTLFGLYCRAGGVNSARSEA